MKISFSSSRGDSILFRTFRPGTAAIAIAIAIASMMPGSLLAQENDGSNSNQRIEEVVVTGSYLSRLRQSNLPSPTSVLGADYISEIGAGNVGDIVQNLTINTGSQNNPDAFTQNGTVGTSNFNLRGLGVASTLVLLNGRRQVNTSALTNDGINFVDTNALVPQIAIKRVEIVKDGAAAIYGTDAVAGVVNFITDNDFTVEAKFGWGNDRTDYVIAASYYDRTELTTSERRLSRAQDDTSSLGNPGAFFLLGQLPVIDPTGCASEGGQPILNAGAKALLMHLAYPFEVGFVALTLVTFSRLCPTKNASTYLVR